MSPTAISSIRNLEARIGVLLFNRTTRSVAVTSAGEAFISRVSGSVMQIAEAIEAAQGLAGRPSGALRINSSVTAGHEILSPLVGEYLRLYPEMKIDLVTDSRLVDIVLQGADAGTRLMDSVPVDMVAVPLGFSLDFSVVGSPAYLARIPEPVTPHELIHHRCVRSRWAGGGIYRWEFERGEEKVNIDVPGALTLDEQSLILKAAISDWAWPISPMH
jgi:DNA-binding transcriptional LysR family regulator